MPYLDEQMEFTLPQNTVRWFTVVISYRQQIIYVMNFAKFGAKARQHCIVRYQFYIMMVKKLVVDSLLFTDSDGRAKFMEERRSLEHGSPQSGVTNGRYLEVQIHDLSYQSLDLRRLRQRAHC